HSPHAYVVPSSCFIKLTTPTHLYPLSLHDALPISSPLTRLRLFVSIRFQDLFHSPPGVLFAFPSRYWFTIGRLRVFSLGGWSPRSEEHTSELQSRENLVCRLLLEKKKIWR